MNKLRFSQIKTFYEDILENREDFLDLNRPAIDKIGEENLKQYILNSLLEKGFSQDDLSHLVDKIYLTTGREIDTKAPLIQELYNVLVRSVLLPDYTNNQKEDFKELDELLDRIQTKMSHIMEGRLENGFFSLRALQVSRIYEELQRFGIVMERNFNMPGIFGGLIVDVDDDNGDLSVTFGIRLTPKQKADDDFSFQRPSMSNQKVDEILKAKMNGNGTIREVKGFENVKAEIIKKKGKDTRFIKANSDEEYRVIRLYIEGGGIHAGESEEDIRSLLDEIFYSTEELVNVFANESDYEHPTRIYNFNTVLPFTIMEEEDDETDALMLTRDEIERFSRLKVDMKEKVKLSEVGGQEKAKNEIEKIINSIRHSEIMQSWGARPTSGIVFEGPAGTGKTLLAKAVASEIDADVYNIKLTDIASSAYINEGSNNVKKLFAFIRDRSKKGKRVVVILDELDALFAKRGNGRSSGEDTKIVNTFLTEMSGLESLENVIFIGTTNLIENIDPAVIRSGRLTTKVKVDNPTKEGIIQIYNIHLKKIAKKSEKFANIIKDINIDEIADKSSGLSGADIEEVVRILAEEKAMQEILGEAIAPLTTQNFENAISKIKQQQTESGRSIGFHAKI